MTWWALGATVTTAAYSGYTAYDANRENQKTQAEIRNSLNNPQALTQGGDGTLATGGGLQTYDNLNSQSSGGGGGGGGGFMDMLFGSSSPGEHGIDTVYHPDYQNFLQGQQAVTDANINALQGNAAAPWEDQYAQLQQMGEEDLNRYYLGNPGDASNSALGLAQQQDAIKGTGRGSATQSVNTNKAINEMAAKKAALSQMFAKNKLDFGQQAYLGASDALNQLTQGPRQTSVGYSFNPQASDGGLVGNLLGGPAGGALMSKGLSMLGGGGATNAAYPNSPNMGGGGVSQYGNVYGANTPSGTVDTGTFSSLA